MKSKSSINLHIEELVLHGFAPGDRHRIGEVVQQELTRLISENQIAIAGSKNVLQSQNSALDFMNGGTFQMQNNSRAEVVGGQIAVAIHNAIGK